MSFWPFRKINEHKNCVVNTKGKFPDNENGSSEENVFESKQPEANENSCTEEYLDFSISCGVMERLKGGHYLKDTSHGCQSENVEGGILNLATPNKNQTREPLTLNEIETPQELKRILRSFSKAYKSQDSGSNSIKALEQKSKFCFENATVQQFLGRIDLGDMNPLVVYYVEVPSNEQALEDKRESKEDTEENSCSLVEANVSKKQEKRLKRPERETSSSKCPQKRSSNNSHGDINRESRQTCQPIKFCCKPLDCTQPMLYRCTLSKEAPSCSIKADKCKELKDYLKRVKDNQQGTVKEEDQQTCKPTKYCCERVDFKPDCSCGCKKPIIYRCTPYPSDPPCTEKSKVCKELDDYLKTTKNVKRESSQSGQPMNGRSSLRKSNEYKGIEDETSSAKESFDNSKGNENVRTCQTQRPSRPLDIQNERSSLRNSSEYKQHKDSLKGVGEEIPRESSNNYQRNSSLRASQTHPSDKPLDTKNGRSSLRKSGEYTQQKDYLNGVEDDIPKEYSNNSQRNSSGRASQAQPLDKSLDFQNGRSSLRKSDGVKTEDEIFPAENVQRESSNHSQGDARVSQTSQSLKTFDRKEDLEETKRSVSEDVSKPCQPIKYSCKRLDSTQYPPCMIKPKGYKQPAVFSCRLCGPTETTSCSDRSSACKELKEYLQSIRKKRQRESAAKNQEDQPKEAFDSKADRPSLRKSKEYKQEDNDFKGVEKEILPDENMTEEYSNNSQGDVNGRASQMYQPFEALDSKDGHSSLRKSNEYKQREDANGRESQSYQPVDTLGRSSFRKSNEYKQREDANERAPQNYQPVETLDSKEGRSSLRKSNEYKQRESYGKGDTTSDKTEPNNDEEVNGRASQSYQPIEALDSKEGPSSLRKSNEYKQREDAIGRPSVKNVPDNQGNANGRVSQSYQPVETLDSKEGRSSFRKSNESNKQQENIHRGSSKSSQGDARASQTSRTPKDFDHEEDTCSSREEIANDSDACEQASDGSQTSRYCCEPVDLTKCQPGLMKTNAGKPPRIYRCWPYDSNQDQSSKRKSNACSGKSKECEPPCENQPCLVKIKKCKIPAKCCCKPCQPKPDPCCQKKTKYRSKPYDSREDPLDLMKTQVIKQLIDFLKDLKVQLTSAKMMQKELFNTNKADGSQNGIHTSSRNRPSQVKRISDKNTPNLVQNNERKQNENDLKNLNKEMPSESCKKIKEVTSRTTNTLRKSCDMVEEVLSNGTQKETPHPPATLIQNISSDTVQPNGLICCRRKGGGCTLSKNKLKASADSSQCPFDPKLNVPGSTNTNVRKPQDKDIKNNKDNKDNKDGKDIKDIKEVMPGASPSQNRAINANTQDSRARKEDSPISKNILSARIDSSEKGSQTEQPINMQNAKAPHKHTLNIAPITLTIPLKLVINSQEGQSNIIETDIIFEGSSRAVPKTVMPINKTMYMPDINGSDGFFSCLSEPGEVEIERLTYVKPQNKSDTTATKAPLNKTIYMQDDSDSDVFSPCLSESDIKVAEPAATVKPQNTVELEEQVKQGINSCTIIPTTVPPASKSVNQQTKTETEKSLKTPLTSEPVPKVEQVKEQILQTPLNVMHITLPASEEPKSESNAKSSGYSTPIDYQGIPTKRRRSQSKSAEPAVADKATSTSYISGHQLRNEMRVEIQEQLKELLELKDTNAKHKYDAQERDAILLELHKIFNPEMVDLLPQEICKEITLTSIRYLVEPELLSSTDNEIAKLSEHQARILEDMRHIINPKSRPSDGARKFHKESKFKILENLRIILNSRKQERSSAADIRENILTDLRSLLETGEVNKSLELEQESSTCQAKDKECQQRSPYDIKESLMSDLNHLLDATPKLQAENKENQGNAVKRESLSNNSSDEPMTDDNKPITTRKVKTAPPRRTSASIKKIVPKPERRKRYRDLQSSSSEDFFLDLHDD